MGSEVGLIVRWLPISEQTGVVGINAEVVSCGCETLHERQYLRAEKVLLELAASRRPAQVYHVVQSRFDLANLPAHVMSQVDGIEKTQAVIDQDTDIPVQPADQLESVYAYFSHNGISTRAQKVMGIAGIFFTGE